MKKNGFTIVEVLAVVVILAILIGISIPIYNNMQESTKEKEYDSKVAYIETKVLEYAEANNISNGEIISVGRLINQGYITADRYEEEMPFLENPKNKEENLACRVVEITQENYEYSAKLSEESNCELINLDSTIAKLGIKAYGIESNGDTYKLIEAIGSDDIRDLNWSKDDVLVIVNPEPKDYDEITIGINGTTRKVSEMVTLNVGDTIRKDAIETKNVEVITSQNITKTEVMISVNKKETTTGENGEEKSKEEVKTVRLQVKIDKEKPTINTSTSDRWSSEGKDSTIYVSDGSGSGPACVFVSDTKPSATVCGGSGSYSATNGVAKLSRLDVGTYYIWAMDKAGNMTDSPTQLLIQNVDKGGPSCDYQGEKKVWSKEDVTIKFGCKDNGVGCKTTSSGRVETFTTSDGNGQVSVDTFEIEDNLGNKETCGKAINVYIDKVAPVVTADQLSVTSQDSRYHTSVVKVSITTTDTQSGIASICFNTNSSSANCNWIDINPTDSTKNQGPLKVTQSSTVNLGSYNGSSHTIYVHVRDRVGNESQTHSLSKYTVYTACSEKTISGYDDWGSCNKECGNDGIKSRTIYYKDSYILNQPCNPETETNPCNRRDCCAETEPYSTSSTYDSNCPAVCGTGSETYTTTTYYRSAYDHTTFCTASTSGSISCGKPDCCDNPVKGDEKPNTSTYSSCPSCGPGQYTVTYYTHSPYPDMETHSCDEIKETKDCGKAACPVEPTCTASGESVTYTSVGTHTYTVPSDGTYKLTVTGAHGADSDSNGGEGGNGAKVTGKITLKKCDVLTIYVGEEGSDDNFKANRTARGYGEGGKGHTKTCNGKSNINEGSTGGGASAVVKGSDILIVAAGGGGAGDDCKGKDGCSGVNAGSGHYRDTYAAGNNASPEVCSGGGGGGYRGGHAGNGDANGKTAHFGGYGGKNYKSDSLSDTTTNNTAGTGGGKVKIEKQ